MKPASGVDLDTLLDQDLLWAQAVDFVELPEKGLSDTRALINEVEWAVHVSKRGYVDSV